MNQTSAQHRSERPSVRSRRDGRPAGTAIALVVSVASFAGMARGEDAIEFNRDIRPILSENCFACHGPDSAVRKADLRLDRREAAIEAEAIVPNDVEASELVARIDSDDPSMRMPPRASH